MARPARAVAGVRQRYGPAGRGRGRRLKGRSRWHGGRLGDAPAESRAEALRARLRQTEAARRKEGLALGLAGKSRKSRPSPGLVPVVPWAAGKTAGRLPSGAQASIAPPAVRRMPVAGAKARLRFPSDGKVHALCAGGYDELCRRAPLTLRSRGSGAPRLPAQAMRISPAQGAGGKIAVACAASVRARAAAGAAGGQAERNSSGRGEGHGDSNGRAGAGDRLCQV